MGDIFNNALLLQLINMLMGLIKTALRSGLLDG